ncbi:type VI secretion system Vgr family protein [Pseudomonas sp. UBA1879]|uniref:type VI secretion system Vgr family protein n=1 Tax=Pseudomonas sp. UBA1879 TaxID=1947305 RepID=UPI0025D94CDD|nr:type VI secretion system Vgr family protein [Pseudomonas sp. UBA1879]
MPGGVSLQQTDRLLQLSIPSEPHLLALRAHGVERLGRIPRYCVDVITGSSTLSPNALIEQPITLSLKLASGALSHRHGFIQSVRYLGSDGALQDWQIKFVPWFGLLEYRRDCRIWQDMPLPEIICDVFHRHPHAEGRYTLSLRREYPKLSYVTQYNESDAHFVQRWCEQEGIYWYVVHEADNHHIFFVDSVDSLPAQAPLPLPFHTQTAALDHDSITHWAQGCELGNGQVTWASNDYRVHQQRQIAQAIALEALAAPASLERYEYRGQYGWQNEDRGQWLTRVQIEQGESAAQRIKGQGGVRSMQPGHGFELTQHPLYEGASPQERAFLLIGVEFFAQSNLPVALQRRDSPGSLKPQMRSVRDENAKESGEGYYFNRFEAQRLDIPYRSPFEHRKPNNPGPQTAVVIAPSGAEVQTDDLNRVCVRFHWDRLTPPERAPSCWIRMMQNSSGDGWGSVHVPRAGEEVVITFLDNDIDRPLILGQVYGGDKPAWHSTGHMSGSKSKEIQGLGYNQWVMDDTTGQVRTQIHSSHSHSQLNLGYLVDQQGNDRGALRGDGFELRTDAFGAIRAQQGLYLSSWKRTKGLGGQMDSSEAREQIRDAEQRMAGLSESATQHNALSLSDGVESVKQLLDVIDQPYRQRNASTEGYQDSLLVASAPADIISTTPQNIHLHSGRQLNVSTGEDVNLVSGRSLLASVANSISLFARNAGAKLFAAKGKVEIQAQDDAIELTAKDSVRITSTARTIEIAAQEEILLTSGAAFIRIKDGNIQIHAPGTVDIRGTTKSISGPEKIDHEMPTWPSSSTTQKLSFLAGQSYAARQQSWAGMPYKLFADGTLIDEGVMSREGELNIEHPVERSRYRLELANGVSHDIPVSGEYLGDPDNAQRANQGIQRHTIRRSANTSSAPSTHQIRQTYAHLNTPDKEA